ncbi:type I-B CRISPR-associated endonuclease Cas1b [Neomoorella thermoacetica]|uniref:CRISPR-associated endonuclease Cas1 2 n=2 Tax=Neomoorella thermoacetica TaxID=1525 RepID=CAS1B_MOOTA|nr:type I-B CRISPR-associated endonuclease Cas1b [Moorella thermoacetica]Q2RHR1.1 RecName: Full=CRISPR-associated endonuclease Cas1 2 [Moorella thermoacetica ATCC 39073]AKX94531.1 CRISPR-associated endonuclease Cas1 [Moorella thermoacetica]AKX97167.1 CRISPR-associated endonuclease Cas1 [Moorella thermoacetica]APC08922.1 CRISPR-associated endonuclease Cas1 [Moorella thermoacetica]OIQ09556.1 CRISPR-associated endonuclease Cas1 [Moorella thermoacetica]OIQ11891.1 CRISPR-associated endonuclease Ca
MRTYYIFSSGRLRRMDNTLALELETERRVVPVEDIDHIYCFSELDLNTRLLDFLAQKQICLHFFNYYGHYSGSFIPRESQLSGFLLVRQVEHYLDQAKRLELARTFVEGALHNIRRNLEKREYDDICSKLDEIREGIGKTASIEELMSLEAHARKAYYDTWEEITGWEFGSRSKRPPANALNALISFGNAMMYTVVLKEIYRTALNPTISYLHEPSERRYSLALDVAEIFKPVFVDRLIFRLINLNMLKETHFDTNVNFVYLTEGGRKVFVKEFEETLEKTILHRKLKRNIRYKSLVRLDLYKLIKHLLGEEKYSPMKVWW